MAESRTKEHKSPPWNRPTKIIVALGILFFILVVLWRFQMLISPLIIAAILSYLLYPVINFINERTHVNRTVVVNAVFITLALVFLVSLAVVGIAAYRQVVSLVQGLPAMIESSPAVVEEVQGFLGQTFTLGGYSFQLPFMETGAIDWQGVTEQILSYLQPVAGSLGNSLGQIALSTIELVGWLVFILFVSIYISNDAPRFSQFISDAADLPGYREDAERLWREFGRIWAAYLRGQAILGLVVGSAVAILLAILGVQNALALGLLSGLLEFIPMIGPIVGAGTAILVAIFQDGNYLGLTTIQYGLLVLAVMALIQQVENNILVPRIVGDTLDLHPLVVLVGAIMGSSLAGILGAILAAPVLATLKLLGTYAWRKMFDMPPFTRPEPEPADHVSWAERAWEKWQLRRARLRQEK